MIQKSTILYVDRKWRLAGTLGPAVYLGLTMSDLKRFRSLMCRPAIGRVGRSRPESAPPGTCMTDTWDDEANPFPPARAEYSTLQTAPDEQPVPGGEPAGLEKLDDVHLAKCQHVRRELLAHHHVFLHSKRFRGIRSSVVQLSQKTALAIGLSPLEKGLKRGSRGLAPCRGPFGRAGKRASKGLAKGLAICPSFWVYK